MFTKINVEKIIKERQSKLKESATNAHGLRNRQKHKRSQYDPVSSAKRCGNCIFFSSQQMHCHQLHQTMYENSYACSSHTSPHE